MLLRAVISFALLLECILSAWGEEPAPCRAVVIAAMRHYGGFTVLLGVPTGW